MNITMLPSPAEVKISVEEINGLRVHRSSPPHASHAETILFQHGMNSHGEMFAQYMRRFTLLGYRCVALTLRGHPGSTKPIRKFGRLTVGDYMQDCEEVLHSIPGRVIGFGHSMGAGILSRVARKWPSRFHAMILPMPVSRGWKTSKKTAFRLMKWNYIRQLAWGSPLTLAEDDARALFLNTVSPEQFAKLYPTLCPESGWVTLQMVIMMYSVVPLECPTLIIGGRHDTLLRRWTAERAERLRADFREVDSCHMTMLDSNSAEVVKVSDEWLRSHVPYHLRQREKLAA